MSTMFCEEDGNNKLFDPYERFSELSKDELQFALRIVHRELNKKMGLNLSDDCFIELFMQIKNERLLHPIGPWSGLGRCKCYDPVVFKHFPDEPRPSGWHYTQQAIVCHKFFKEYFPKG